MSSEENENEIDEIEAELQRKKQHKREPKKEPDEVIEIRHTDDRNKPLRKNERQEYENLQLIVEAEALKKFETDKTNLLARVPEHKREAIEKFISDDPEKLETVKAQLILQGQTDFDDEDEEEISVPKGRAKLPDYLQNEGRTVRTATYTNPTIEQYSELYRIIRDPKSSAEQKAEAERILDETFVEIRRGLRSRSPNNPYMLPHGVVSHCMNCGAVVEADLTKVPCPYCGFDWSKDKLPRNPKFQPQ